VGIAEQVELFVQKNTRVKGTLDTKVKRSLLVFGRDRKEVEVEELVIEKSRHVYTDQYINLVKDFYLKM